MDLQKINFMLLARSPEEDLCAVTTKSVLFQSFREKQIFPKRSDIGSRRQWRKVSDDCIANTVVVKVDLLAKLDLRLRVT